MPSNLPWTGNGISTSLLRRYPHPIFRLSDNLDVFFFISALVQAPMSFQVHRIASHTTPLDHVCLSSHFLKALRHPKFFRSHADPRLRQ